jgi:tetratricopeptide (TPR) repeat protein
LFAQQRFTEAVAAQREAIRLQPDFAKAHYYLGEALGRLGRHEEAYAAYGEVIRLKPDHVNSWLNRGFLMTELGSLEEALASYRQALSLDPQCATAAVGEAWILEKQGDFTQAYERLQPFLAAEHPDAFAAVVFATLCRPLGRCDEAIALMERILEQEGPALDNPQRATLHFELGRLYDRKNAFDAAFRHFTQGNKLKGQSRHFDAEAHARYIDALIQTYNSQFLAQAPRPTHRSQRPVFIIGMPRSGTSVVEQILASHPAVHGGGELLTMNSIVKDLPGMLGSVDAYPFCLNTLTQAHVDQLAQRYLDHLQTLSPDAARVTDKMPTNFLHLGLINILFPEARVIHCIRDPLDTCLSCYFQNFGPWDAYTQDLRSLGAFYREYQRLMEHWATVLDIATLDVKYEELVADQEGISRKMTAFCGLEWDDRCLRFYDSKRAVASASHDQVRQPIYQRSVGRWKNYAAYLEPLKESLALH